MRFREIGSTGVKLSELSVGCSAIGGYNWIENRPHGWPPVPDDEVRAAIKAAVDAGVNHFDCADLYGNGTSERRLAQTLKALGLRSEDFVISSKVGWLQGSAEHAYHPFHIRKQCEQSLINLQREYLDIYYLHHDHFGEKNQWLEPAAEALDALQREGKIRLKGQSAYSDAGFEKSVRVLRPQIFQSWANALQDNFIRPGSRVAELCDQHGVGFTAFSPVAQGRLLGVFDARNPPDFAKGDVRGGGNKFSAETLAALEPKINRLRERFGRDTESLAGAAIQYVLSHACVSAVLLGFQRAEQLAGNLRAKDFAFTQADAAFISSVFAE